MYKRQVLTASVVIVFLWGVYVFQQLDLARRRADVLLLSILPAPIADRLKRGPATIANGYDEVTVLFADIVNFTSLSADADPVDVVSFLNGLFSQFDDLAAGHGLETVSYTHLDVYKRQGSSAATSSSTTCGATRSTRPAALRINPVSTDYLRYTTLMRLPCRRTPSSPPASLWSIC